MAEEPDAQLVGPPPVLLFQFPPNEGGFRPSSPCVAVEAYLRFGSVDYENITSNPLRGSNTDILPAVRVEGRTISDSENIIRFFESRSKPALDQSLTKAEHAKRVMLTRLMNGSIYQLMVAERWLDPEVYPRFVESFRTMLPSSMRALWPLVRPVLARRVRGKYTKSIAHLSSEERLVFARENFSALAQQLGNRPYLFGDLPTSADAYLFAYIYAFVAVPFDSPIRRMLESEYPDLISFYSRVAPLAVGDLP